MYIMEKVLSGITIEKALVYSNTLKSSDVSWYRNTFGTMHRYSCTHNSTNKQTHTQTPCDMEYSS